MRQDCSGPDRSEPVPGAGFYNLSMRRRKPLSGGELPSVLVAWADRAVVANTRVGVAEVVAAVGSRASHYSANRRYEPYDMG